MERVSRDVRNKMLRDAFAKEVLKKAFKRRDKDFSKFEEEEIKKAFNKAMTGFYESYNPKKYKRQGDTDSETGGLYDLLSLKISEDQYYLEFPDDYSSLYDKAMMHNNRRNKSGFNASEKGGSLFEIVFEAGYHGGATYISEEKEDDWGTHPHTGTPYWRTKGYVKSLKRVHPFGKWYSTPAEHDDTGGSPHERFIKEMDELLPELGKKYKTLERQYVDEEWSGFLEHVVPSVLKKAGWYGGNSSISVQRN